MATTQENGLPQYDGNENAIAAIFNPTRAIKSRTEAYMMVFVGAAIGALSAIFVNALGGQAPDQQTQFLFLAGCATAADFVLALRWRLLAVLGFAIGTVGCLVLLYRLMGHAVDFAAAGNSPGWGVFVFFLILVGLAWLSFLGAMRGALALRKHH